MMRLVIVLFSAFVAVLALPRPAGACVQLAEANKLLGWSADGSRALYARVVDGKVAHAEILPTRYEGWKYIIVPDGGSAIEIKKVAVTSCEVLEGRTSARVTGRLTEASLLRLDVVKAMRLVPLPGDDGGASKLTASFTPKKRYAEHRIQLRDAGKVVATLPVPGWCVGSCLRDEDRRSWGASVTQVARAGGRTLYVVRMKKVCNGGNDKDMWILRVIAAPGDEAAPKRGRCRGSGE